MQDPEARNTCRTAGKSSSIIVAASCVADNKDPCATFAMVTGEEADVRKAARSLRKRSLAGGFLLGRRRGHQGQVAFGPVPCHLRGSWSKSAWHINDASTAFVMPSYPRLRPENSSWRQLMYFSDSGTTGRDGVTIVSR